MKLSMISKIAGAMVVVLIAAFLAYQRSINDGRASAPHKEELSAADMTDDTVEKSYLNDLTGKDSLAVARRAYVPGQFIFSIQAFLPSEDQGYVVWVADGKGDTINLGPLEKKEDSYYLEYKSEKNLTPFNKIYVSSSANTAKGLIMEGNFGAAN